MFTRYYRPSAIIGGCMILAGLAIGSPMGVLAMTGRITPGWMLLSLFIFVIGFFVFLYGIADEGNRWKMRTAFKSLLLGLAAGAIAAAALWFFTPLRGKELATLAFAVSAVGFIVALVRKM